MTEKKTCVNCGLAKREQQLSNPLSIQAVRCRYWCGDLELNKDGDYVLKTKVGGKPRKVLVNPCLHHEPIKSKGDVQNGV